MRLDKMTPITEAVLLADFESILDRVTAGEYFLLDEKFVLMPYTAYQPARAIPDV